MCIYCNCVSSCSGFCFVICVINDTFSKSYICVRFIRIICSIIIIIIKISLSGFLKLRDSFRIYLLTTKHISLEWKSIVRAPLHDWCWQQYSVKAQCCFLFFRSYHCHFLLILREAYASSNNKTSWSLFSLLISDSIYQLFCTSDSLCGLRSIYVPEGAIHDTWFSGQHWSVFLGTKM